MTGFKKKDVNVIEVDLTNGNTDEVLVAADKVEKDIKKKHHKVPIKVYVKYGLAVALGAVLALGTAGLIARSASKKTNCDDGEIEYQEVTVEDIEQ